MSDSRNTSSSPEQRQQCHGTVGGTTGTAAAGKSASFTRSGRHRNGGANGGVLSTANGGTKSNGDIAAGVGNKDELSANYAEAVGLSSLRRKIIFACLAANSTFVMICIAVMIPFFPRVAGGKDPDDKEGVGGASAIGFVFSIAPFGEFLASPLVGRLAPHLGPKLVIAMGGVMVGGCIVLFGWVHLIDDWGTFLGVCYALRFFQGVGTALNVTATFAILIGIFPNNISLVAGTLRAFHSVGFTVGPVLAGVLYDNGGFTLPFAVHGALMLAGSVWVMFALPADVEVATQSNGNKMLKDCVAIPWSCVWLVSIFLYGLTIGMLDPNVSPFVEEAFGLTATEVGLIYLLYASVIAIGAPLVGHVADRWINPNKFQAMSLVLAALGLIFVGPWTATTLGHALWRTCFGMCLIAAGAAMCITCTTSGVLNAIKEVGYEDTLELHSNLGGTITTVWSAGLAFGPTIGGTLAGAIGFEDASAIFAAVMLTGVVFGSVVGGYKELKRCSGSYDPERQRLITSNEQSTKL